MSYRRFVVPDSWGREIRIWHEDGKSYVAMDEYSVARFETQNDLDILINALIKLRETMEQEAS